MIGASLAILHRVAATAMAAAGLACLITSPARAEGASAPAPAGCTGPQSETWLQVAVEDVRSSQGMVALTLYDDDRSRFLVKRGSLYVTRVKARAGMTSACIFLPGPGVYALAIYHDEDGDSNFDRSGLGLPNEGFGFSNNPSTLAGLPSFSSVRLSVPRSGMLTRIRLKYP